MLDGVLDAAGEQSVLDLLAADPMARREFAQLAQVHAWLATSDSTGLLTDSAGPAARRKILSHPAWWLAAAVAAAVILFTMSKLWPSPGYGGALTYHEDIRPLLAAACVRCHVSLDKLVTGNANSGLAMISPGRPEQSALWHRLSGRNPCAQSLDSAGKSLLIQWINAGSAGLAAS